jgi:adenosylmethionine-8-amino-7-oxononanoate aminotransferase
MTAAYSPDQLKAEAAEHYTVPLASKADVARDGLRIYVEGEGTRLIDVDGRSYLDMTSAHTRANSLGYGNHEIARAVYEQLATLHYIGSRNNVAEPTIHLGAKVAELAPGDLNKIIFTSGGSEAVESALKLAKSYHLAVGRKPKATKIISRWNAYHGATMGALSATDWLGMRHIMEPGVPGGSYIPGPMNYRNPFNMDEDAYIAFCADYLEQQILREGPEYVAAFIAEPVMQANGVQIAPPSYFQRVREICDKYDVLWIDDEVITGFGRTGNWFAVERMGVLPDMMTMAKAMTAGYMPMGGMIARAEIFDALPAYRHMHTFMGHAGAAACALKVIEIKERENLVEKVRVDGAYFLDALKQELEPLPIVGQVRGIGFWLAVDFTSDKATKAAFTDDTVVAIVNRMYAAGVIANANGTAFEVAPPYTISRADLDLTVGIARDAIVAVAKERGLF